MRRLMFVLALVAAVTGQAGAYELRWPGLQSAIDVSEFGDGTLALGVRYSTYPGYNDSAACLMGILPAGIAWEHVVDSVHAGVTTAPMPNGNMLTAATNGSIFVTNSAGAILASRHFPWIVFDGVAVAADGAIYAIGSLMHPEYQDTSYTAFLARLDTEGTIDWMHRIGPPNPAYLRLKGVVIATPDGGACVAGSNTHKADVDVAIIVRRFDASGNETWQTAVAVDSMDGNVNDMTLSDDGVIGLCGAFGDYSGTGKTCILGLDLEFGDQLWSVDIPNHWYEYTYLRAIASIGNEFVAVGTRGDAIAIRVSSSGELLEELFFEGDPYAYKLADICPTHTGNYIAVGSVYGYNREDILIIQIPGPGQDSDGELLARN